MSCVFCQITSGENPAKFVYQDELVIAFRDIRPISPIHILVVPKKHIASVNEMTPEDEPLIGHLFFVAKLIAEQEGVVKNGYRLFINNGAGAGQTIFHLHLHLISGGKFSHSKSK